MKNEEEVPTASAILHSSFIIFHLRVRPCVRRVTDGYNQNITNKQKTNHHK